MPFLWALFLSRMMEDYTYGDFNLSHLYRCNCSVDRPSDVIFCDGSILLVFLRSDNTLPNKFIVDRPSDVFHPNSVHIWVAIFLW